MDILQHRDLRLRWLLLVLVTLLLHFSGSATHGLLEPDEGRYANMAVEWTEFAMHDWAEPMLSDVGHFDKPPLVYWLTGVSMLAFGENEVAARLPSLLGSLLTLAGVALLAWRQYGERVAWWSAAVCTTSLHFWALGQLLSPDMLLCGFCTLGAALVLSSEKSWSGRVIWVLGALCWALAWWTKATAALVPLGAITVALLLAGRRDLLAKLRPIRLLILILLLGCPWYLLMIHRHPELNDFFFHRELAGRITGHADGRTGFPGYHFAVAMGMWLPWWPFLLEKALGNFRAWRQLQWRERLTSLPWEPLAAIIVVVIFSFVSSKLVTYILPGLPLLAIGEGKGLGANSFTFESKPAKVMVATFFFLLLGGQVMPFLENRLDSNSSLRGAVAEAKELGAELLLLDRHRPSAEFYFGENVVYVNAENISQVRTSLGQDLKRHFVTVPEAKARIKSTGGGVVFIQTRTPLPDWAARVLAKHPLEDRESRKLGDFTIWKIK